MRGTLPSMNRFTITPTLWGEISRNYSVTSGARVRVRADGEWCFTPDAKSPIPDSREGFIGGSPRLHPAGSLSEPFL